MRPIVPTSIIIILLAHSLSFAEVKEIIAEGTYSMGDGETPSVSESRALFRAKQVALEQAGTYVESYSKVKGLTLAHDEIQVLASGIMEVSILDKKRSIVGDGINFWIKIKAKINTDKIEAMTDRLKDKSLLEDYKNLQESYAKSQREIDQLKKEREHTTNKEQLKSIDNKIANREVYFKVTDLLEQGHTYMDAKNYDKAFDVFSMALSLSTSETHILLASSGRSRALFYRISVLKDKALACLDGHDFSCAIGALEKALVLDRLGRDNFTQKDTLNTFLRELYLSRRMGVL